MPGNGFTREALFRHRGCQLRARAGPDTPSRTAAHFARRRWCFGASHRRARAPICVPRWREHRSPCAACRCATAQAIVDLARAAMVTRARSLEAFSFADARDAWFVDDGDGLAFAFIGVIPQRRHAVASYYGGLTLRNGVPIGYMQADIVGRSAALSFNTFDTFRGGEAAFTFARWLAALRHVFGATSFSIEPYQLGQDNDEALESGAWWFYAKLGFAPRDAATRRLARDERARVQRSPRHRTPPRHAAPAGRAAPVLRPRPGAAAAAARRWRAGPARRRRAVGAGRLQPRARRRRSQRRTAAPLRPGLAARLLGRPARGLAPPGADPHAARPRRLGRRRAPRAGGPDPRQGRAQRARLHRALPRSPAARRRAAATWRERRAPTR